MKGVTFVLLRSMDNLANAVRPSLACASTTVRTLRFAMKPLEPCSEDSPLHGIRGIRHCAFCLKPCSTVACCSGCHRRAYCSEGCQDKDWRVGEGGQGHSIWCSLGCGEEDLDWEVRPAPGKGLGVFALRDFPRFTRIMAEGPAEDSHPAIADLMPVNASIPMKKIFNAYGKQGLNLYLRAARVNHDCRPNAYHIGDADIQAGGVFSTRDINAGDEITMAYTFFNDPLFYKDAVPSPEKIRTDLLSHYSIVCPADCYCRDPVVYSNCRKAAIMVHKLEAAMVEEQADEVMMDHVEAALAMADIIEANTMFQHCVLIHAVNFIANDRGASRQQRQKGVELLKELIRQSRVMFHPATNHAQTLEKQFEKQMAMMMK